MQWAILSGYWVVSTLAARSSAHRSAASRKILIYALNYAPEPIGCGKYAGELGDYLADQGHSVTVVTAPPHYPGWRVNAPYKALSYSQETIHGTRVLRCPIFARGDGRGLFRLLAPLSFALTSAPVAIYQIIARRPDVVVCVEPTLLAAPAALAAAKLAGAKTVLHVQDLEIDAAFAVGHLKWRLLHRLARSLERFVLKRFNKVITISGRMRAGLLDKGVAQEKCAIVRNWIDTRFIFPLNASDNAYRAELGLGPEKFVVLYAGHLGVKQALGFIVSAARRLVDHKEIAFVLAGEGPERARLMDEAAGLPNVTFLPLQPAERLNELLNMADLHVLPQAKAAEDLVLPSKLGGMLASGRPVIAMADPGTELALVLEKAAIVVPAGSVEGLAEGILNAAHSDLKDQVAAGSVVAESLDARQVLRSFETMLVST